MAQEFFTAAELIAIAGDRGLTDFPSSDRAFRRLAEREGWDALPVSLVRWRKAERRGQPAREYHWSILPAPMQAAISGRAHRAQLAAAQDLDRVTAARQLAAVQAAGRGPRAAAILEARTAVLAAIDGCTIRDGITRAAAIRRFMAAQAQWRKRQDAEAKRRAGGILTGVEAAALACLPDMEDPRGFALDEATVSAANGRPAMDRGIGERTLWRWFKARDEAGSGALSPLPPKEAVTVPKAFLEFMTFYAQPGKPTIAAAHAEYLKAVARRAGGQPEPVSLSQARRILRVRLNNLEKHVGREGILTLKSRMAYVTRATDDLWPTTIYTADGKTFDAEVADPVSRRPMRPEITSVLDVATRKCVGFAVSRKEGVIAVTEGLRRACLTYGIPAIFYTDRGPGYKNKTLDGDDDRALMGLMGRLGITKMHALPYNSQAKGVVERFQATWNDLARRLPTYIGRDMDKEAGQRAHKATRSDIRQFGASSLLMPWEDFLARCEAHITEYNARPHTGLPRYEDPQTGALRHMSPDEAWAAHVSQGFEPVTVETKDEDDLFRPYVVRVTRRALVEWNTNEYFHPDLEAWHQKRVAVGYDLHQGDRVWVRAIDSATGQPGGLICVAVFGGNRQRYVPLSFQQAAEENRARTRLRRLGQKAEAVEAELRAPLIELRAEMPMPDLGRPGPEPLPARHADSVAAPSSAAAITSDADLAKLCLTDPAQLTEGRARVLREMMSRRNGRELLRISGVDLDELDDLLRSAA